MEGCNITMISAEQAREINSKIDWKARMLEYISRNIETLADAGYTKYDHRFNTIIPEKEIEKIIKDIESLGYFVQHNPKDASSYIISWKEATNI